MNLSESDKAKLENIRRQARTNRANENKTKNLNVTSGNKIDNRDSVRFGKHKIIIILLLVVLNIIIWTLGDFSNWKPFGIGSTNLESAIQSVKSSIIARVGASGRNYESGPLEDGTAVLVDDLAAYWVKGGTVYAANGHAKAWSPSISYVSSGKVTYDSVKASVR